MKDIKTVGEYAATVVFHKEVKVEIPVTVFAEGNTADSVAAVAEEVAAPAEEAAPAAEEANAAE